MSAMRDLSRAIRHELTEYGPTLKDIPTDVLRDLVSVLGAFWLDMKGELEEREKQRRE